jgi:adenylate kinase
MPEERLPDKQTIKSPDGYWCGLTTVITQELNYKN